MVDVYEIVIKHQAILPVLKLTCGEGQETMNQHNIVIWRDPYLRLIKLFSISGTGNHWALILSESSQVLSSPPVIWPEKVNLIHLRIRGQELVHFVTFFRPKLFSIHYQYRLQTWYSWPITATLACHMDYRGTLIGQWVSRDLKPWSDIIQICVQFIVHTSRTLLTSLQSWYWQWYW